MRPKERIERQGVSLHEGRNLAFLLLHHRQQRELLLARVVLRGALMRLLLSCDLLPNWDWIDVNGDCVVAQSEVREPVNDAGKQPALSEVERVIFGQRVSAMVE